MFFPHRKSIAESFEPKWPQKIWDGFQSIPNITSVDDTLFWTLLTCDCPVFITTSKGRVGSDEVLYRFSSFPKTEMEPENGSEEVKANNSSRLEAIASLGLLHPSTPALCPFEPTQPPWVSGEARSMGRERRETFPCSSVCDIRRALTSKVYLDLFPLVVISTPAITEIHHRLRGRWRVVGVCFSSGVDGKLFILSLFGVMSVQRGPRRRDCTGRGQDGVKVEGI